MKPLLLLILVTLALFSCKKDDNKVVKENDSLIGNWIKPEYNDTLVTYTRAGNLLNNEIGYSFNTGNTCIVRQNSGFCGTPPITTADYEGTWSSNDSLVNISSRYWGGKMECIWKIISINDEKLVVATVKVEYQEGK